MSELKNKLNDPEYLDFLKNYYREMWNLAYDMTPKYGGEIIYELIGKTFEKIASPSVYLDQEFEKWKRNKIGLTSELEKAKESIGSKR